jgi:hypothetical protein
LSLPKLSWSTRCQLAPGRDLTAAFLATTAVLAVVAGAASASGTVMPYRPPANATKCAGNGGWFRGGNCFHGKLFKISFALKGVTLSTNAIISVSYSTTDYGQAPTGVPGPYDSLNVGTTSDNPSTGTYPSPNDAYYNTTFAGFYCDGGAGGTGTFRLDAGCWTGTQPTIQVTTG